jgi:hypothetical protein
MNKPPDDLEVDGAVAVLEAYFSALGKIAHEWNHLQEELGQTFCAAAGLHSSMGMAIWHALKSDRSQRDLLDAAVRAAAADDRWSKRFPAAEEGVRWLLKQINVLAERRNDAVHAPCSVVSGETDLEVFAISFFKNPRAQRLREKDILREFAWYEGTAEALRRHARAVRAALSDERYPWPQKPLLPTLEQKSDHQDRPRRSRSKLHPRPRGSSPE